MLDQLTVSPGHCDQCANQQPQLGQECVCICHSSKESYVQSARINLQDGSSMEIIFEDDPDADLYL